MPRFLCLVQNNTQIAVTAKVSMTTKDPVVTEQPTPVVVCRYGLNIGFNLWNKQVFNYFPFPWTVSAVHVVVGLIYCTISYLVGAKKASFGRVRFLTSTDSDTLV